MDEEEKKAELKNLILEVDQELEKTGMHEIIKRLELSRKKAHYNLLLCDVHGWEHEHYYEEFLRLTDELTKQKKYMIEVNKQLQAEAKKHYIKPKRIN